MPSSVVKKLGVELGSHFDARYESLGRRKESSVDMRMAKSLRIVGSSHGAETVASSFNARAYIRNICS